jgi:hypothetical protein
MDAGILSAIWEFASSDKASNLANLVMGSAVLLAYHEYMSGRAEKQKTHEEDLRIKREEIDSALVEQYIAVLDDFIEHPELDSHDKPLDTQQAQQQKRIYQKLIILFSTAFRRLHGEDDPGLKKQWISWEDDISDWVSLPNFRSAFEDLVTGETEEFIAYMREKMNTPLIIADPNTTHTHHV